MEKITAVGLDLAKSSFQFHGSDTQGRPVLRKKLRRKEEIKFFAELPGRDGSLFRGSLLGT